MLIKAGANVNARSKWGDTALMFAAKNYHIEIVELLKNAEAKE
jgi:ankyrin repeat protein